MWALGPRCLVLDETTALMDPSARAETLAMAQRLVADGLAIVWVTHFMDEVAHANRVVALDHGRVAYDGAPAGLFADLALCRSLGLGLPPAAQVAQGLLGRGLPLAQTALTLPALVADLTAAWKEGR
jgi:ABC-type multidrug transport system ATPase subunit